LNNDIKTNETKITICKNGCNKPVKRIGLCSSCYNKHLKEVKRNNNQLCTIKGCKEVEFSKGYCTKHYKQIYRNGEIKRTIYDSNEYIIKNDIAEIILYNKNCEETARAIINIEDIEKAKQYKWYQHSNGYVVYKSDKEIIYLHRLIMSPQSNMVIDHINGNTLDNRKINLRICTQQQNLINKEIQSNNTSKVTGVHWNKTYYKWQAYINLNSKKKNLGYYDNKEDAIKARIEAEVKYFGEFSRIISRNE
jgi:hypothetical protein